MQVFVVAFALLGLHFMAKGARESATGTYENTIREVCGAKFGMMSTTFIILYTYGSCIAYMIVLGDQFDSVFQAVTDTDGKWYLDRRFIIAIASLLFILPLCIPGVN